MGCPSGEVKPVDIFPEDACSNCRMAVSDHRFAAEIISEQGEVFKFDDIGCMERFREKRSDVVIAATYLKDYETKEWVPSGRATILETDIDTPMGSGKIAFSDSVQAGAFRKNQMKPVE
jgi:copper chaperone NosL